MTEPLYLRIGAAAMHVGVETHVLRFWEVEFNIRPQRSKSGQRVYTRKQVQAFGRIRQLLYVEGMTIPGARKAIREGYVPGECRFCERLAKRVLELEVQVRGLEAIVEMRKVEP